MKFVDKLSEVFSSLKLTVLFWILISLIGRYDENYRIHTRKEATKACNDYVLSQNFFKDDLIKKRLDMWSLRYYKGLNNFIRGLSNPSPLEVSHYELYKSNLSELILSTDGLFEDTLLFRGEKDVDLDSRFRVGEKNKFVGFISTSFLESVGRKFSKGKNIKDGYLIIIKAKKGTKGIALNGIQIGEYANQYEWLLNDGQEYLTKHVDEINRIIEIELINEVIK